MRDRWTRRTVLAATVSIAVVGVALLFYRHYQTQAFMSPEPKLLTDPFLQLPTANSVRVVWFTEFSGSRHTVAYGQNLEQMAIATTTKLSRTREDQNSRVGAQTEDEQLYQQPVLRDIWRHEAEVTGLVPGVRVPYQVTSINTEGQQVQSAVFTLAAMPEPATPLKILLTSDHQLKPMTAANLQKMAETVGQVDAVFFAGDLVNIPDRASEWFDDNRGSALFPGLQGRSQYKLGQGENAVVYKGAAIIQHAPMFTAIGNHEVIGRFSMATRLNDQFEDAIPRQVAQDLYQQKASSLNSSSDPTLRDAWIKDHSFNVDTYEEIFTLPQSETGGKKYYAVTFGDVRLVVLYITNIWRSPHLGETVRGKYRERTADFDNPANWGYGQHIFEAIAPGSPQYQWLQQELKSPAFQQAKYKVVMFHHPPHSLGENILPAYTDPVQQIERNAAGEITAIRYEYPREADYIIRDVAPLLEQAGVQLVFYGHSHLWNRFISSSGMHFLESSNVGNSYGAFLGDKKRIVPDANYQEDYAATGNPNGLEPIVPTIAPLQDSNGNPLPYIASNDITAFSIFDTATGTVSSYRFDTRSPNSPVIKFDEFQLKQD